MRYTCKDCGEDMTDAVEAEKARRRDPHVIAKSRTIYVYCSKGHVNVFDMDG